MEIDASAPMPSALKGQDPEYYAVLLEPAHGMDEQDEFYVATRRLLLARKAVDAKLKRQVSDGNILVFQHELQKEGSSAAL